MGVAVQSWIALDVDRLVRGAAKGVNCRKGGVWSFSQNKPEIARKPCILCSRAKYYGVDTSITALDVMRW